MFRAIKNALNSLDSLQTTQGRTVQNVPQSAPAPVAWSCESCGAVNNALTPCEYCGSAAGMPKPETPTVDATQDVQVIVNGKNVTSTAGGFAAIAGAEALLEGVESVLDSIGDWFD